MESSALIGTLLTTRHSAVVEGASFRLEPSANFNSTPITSFGHQPNPNSPQLQTKSTQKNDLEQLNNSQRREENLITIINFLISPASRSDTTQSNQTEFHYLVVNAEMAEFESQSEEFEPFASQITIIEDPKNSLADSRAIITITEIAGSSASSASSASSSPTEERRHIFSGQSEVEILDDNADMINFKIDGGCNLKIPKTLKVSDTRVGDQESSSTSAETEGDTSSVEVQPQRIRLRRRHRMRVGRDFAVVYGRGI